MPIDTDRLKALYQAAARSPELSSRKDCPSPKKLIGVLRSNLSARQAARVIDHISHCAGCADEFGFLAEALRSENVLLQDIEQWLSGRKPEETPGRYHGDRLEPRTRAKSFFGWFSWRAVPVAVGLILVGFVISTRLVFRNSETYRAEPAARVELLRPAEGAVSGDALVFKWRKIPQAGQYILRLFDHALAPVWQSEMISTDSVRLPPDAAAKLENGRSYFWLVTARLANGLEIRSALREFSVEK